MVMMWGGLVGHWDAVDSLNGFISLFFLNYKSFISHLLIDACDEFLL